MLRRIHCDCNTGAGWNVLNFEPAPFPSDPGLNADSKSEAFLTANPYGTRTTTRPGSSTPTGSTSRATPRRFIRVQLALAPLPDWDPRAQHLLAEREPLSGTRRSGRPPAAARRPGEFHRGFVDELKTDVPGSFSAMRRINLAVGAGAARSPIRRQ